MSLNTTVSAMRPHIAFFGRRNVGKSSVVNALTNQNLSVVSDTLGTTTDPVKKAMELLPLGAVVIIDTPGFDDEGALGQLRVEKTKEILRKTDIAVLVADATAGLSDGEKELVARFEERKLPYLIALNKSDLLEERPAAQPREIYISAKTKEGIEALKETLARLIKSEKAEKKIVCDLLNSGDVAVLVIPIDESAPKGRLILPQQMTIRELLDHHCTAVCCQPDELSDVLGRLKEKPAMVITDSQAFKKVAAATPREIALTSFSILFSRYKGDLATLCEGAKTLDSLKDGDHILISEGCTHHRRCGDIGTVKLPAWIERYSKVKPVYEFSSGNSYPEDLERFRLVIHCGGCMLNEKEMHYRLNAAKEKGVPILNYGIAIAHLNGILKRAIEPFGEVRKLFE